MKLIDTHSHIYLPTLAGGLPELLARARTAGVEKILMPAIDSETHESVIQTALSHPDTCLPMMGLHPCSVKADYEKELGIAKEYLFHPDKKGVNYCAVGECGLDYYWDKTFIAEQKIAFEEQIRWGLELDLPVVIHSRESTDDCIEIIEKFQDGKLRGVFHCFSGSREQALRITAAGFHLGIGGVITYKKSDLAEAVRDIDAEWLLVETDAPYLAPVPYRGKPNEPAYIVHTLEKLAGSRGLHSEEMAMITTNNALKLFRI